MSTKPSKPRPRRKALGKGLDALLGAQKKPQAPELSSDAIRQIPMKDIFANPKQPRLTFSQQALEELAQSLREDGMIQPIVVQPDEDGSYTVVVGERRVRAAQLAGLESIPAIVKTIAEDRLLEIALVENIQREDLNSIEVALALQQMVEELSLSHEELAQRTGKDRATVTNLLRLLRLPKAVQELVARGKIANGHAKALLTLDDPGVQVEIAAKAAEQGLSVRQVETMVRAIVDPPPPKPKKQMDPNVEAAVQEIEARLGARVRLFQRVSGRGRIEIEYGSAEELDRIYALLTREE